MNITWYQSIDTLHLLNHLRDLLKLLGRPIRVFGCALYYLRMRTSHFFLLFLLLFSFFFLQCRLCYCRVRREAVAVGLLRDKALAGIPWPCSNHLCARSSSFAFIKLPSQRFIHFNAATVRASAEGVNSTLNPLFGLSELGVGFLLYLLAVL